MKKEGEDIMDHVPAVYLFIYFFKKGKKIFCNVAEENSR